MQFTLPLLYTLSPPKVKRSVEKNYNWIVLLYVEVFRGLLLLIMSESHYFSSKRLLSFQQLFGISKVVALSYPGEEKGGWAPSWWVNRAPSLSCDSTVIAMVITVVMRTPHF